MLPIEAAGAEVIKIGQSEVLETHSLLIPEFETATIDLNIYGWEIQARISFLDGQGAQEVEINATSNGVELVFKNWNNVLGTALNTPGSIGTIRDGGTLAFMACNYRIGNTNQLIIQFLHQRQIT